MTHSLYQLITIIHHNYDFVQAFLKGNISEETFLEDFRDFEQDFKELNLPKHWLHYIRDFFVSQRQMAGMKFELDSSGLNLRKAAAAIKENLLDESRPMAWADAHRLQQAQRLYPALMFLWNLAYKNQNFRQFVEKHGCKITQVKGLGVAIAAWLGKKNSIRKIVSADERYMASGDIGALTKRFNDNFKHITEALELYYKLQRKSKGPKTTRRSFVRRLFKAGAAAATAGSVLHAPLSNEPKELAPRGAAKILRRAVEVPEVNKVIHTEGSYQNAEYYAVIPHSTELNALEAARSECLGPITWVGGNGDRNLRITVNGKIFEIDPNRVFWESGAIRNFEFLNGRWNRLTQREKEAFIAAMQKFVDEIYARIFPTPKKMVLALHQNTQNNFDINYYRDNPAFAKHAAEVHVNPDIDPDYMAFVTTKGWFEVLKAQNWNVVLQNNNPETNDGSISYASFREGIPYVNIEVQEGDHERQAEMIETINSLIERFPELATNMDYVPEGYPPSKGTIFLSFDDGPGEVADLIRQYLKSNNFGAVFFWRGDHILKNRELAIQSVKDGFIIGNHSYNHPRFDEISYEEAISQITRTDQIIDEIYREAGIERKFKLFRYPYNINGGENQFRLKNRLDELGYSIWFWHRDTRDWEEPDVDLVLERVTNLVDGEIILLHDRQHTYEVYLDPICRAISHQGFHIGLPDKQFELLDSSYAQKSIQQDMILINDERKNLTKEYSNYHYSIDDWRLQDPQAIVIHSTDTDTYEQAHNTFYPVRLKGRSDISFAGSVNVSAHFIIDREGSIYQQAPLNFMCRHAIGYNWTALGIENVSTPAKRMSDVQIRSNAWLVQYLIERFSSIRYIFAHKDYAQKPQSILIKAVGDPSFVPLRRPKQDPYGNDFNHVFRSLSYNTRSELKKRQNQ